MKTTPLITGLTALWLLTQGAYAADGNLAGWQDNATTRLKALALLQTLNATLLSQASATQTLQQWCDDHHMASPAQIRAQLDNDTRKEADDEIRARLQAQPGERVAYRRVKLSCGPHILSVADNWYLPSRLDADMNRLLETTDTPFGRAVAALKFRRQTEQVRVLWNPLPTGWELAMPHIPARDTPLQIAPEVLQHRAVLYRGSDNAPFSVVVETYQRAIFNFPLGS